MKNTTIALLFAFTVLFIVLIIGGLCAKRLVFTMRIPTMAGHATSRLDNQVKVELERPKFIVSMGRRAFRHPRTPSYCGTTSPPQHQINHSAWWLYSLCSTKHQVTMRRSKNTACQRCRNDKTRCEALPDSPSCARCRMNCFPDCSSPSRSCQS